MKFKSIIAFFLVLISITSCITIEESYVFNADGSGEMTYSIDFSEYSELLESMNTPSDESDEVEISDAIQTEDPLVEMHSMLDSKANGLEDIDGITKVRLEKSKKNVIALTFHFKDITSLNKALNKIISETGTETNEYFTLNGKQLIHKTFKGDLENSMFGSEDDAETREMAEMFMEQMHYTVNMSFEKAVKSVTTDGVGILSSDKKSFNGSVNFKELSDNPEILDVKIKR